MSSTTIAPKPNASRMPPGQDDWGQTVLMVSLGVVIGLLLATMFKR